MSELSTLLVDVLTGVRKAMSANVATQGGTLVGKIEPDPDEPRESFIHRCMSALSEEPRFATNEAARFAACSSMYESMSKAKGAPICGQCGESQFDSKAMKMACGHDIENIQYGQEFSQLIGTIFEKAEFRVAKALDEKDFTLVKGPVLIPDEVDQQGDIISAEEIEEAAHHFMAHANRAALMHSQMLAKSDAHVVESYVASGPTTIGKETFDEGTWLVAMRVYHPQVRQMIREGRFRGFSIGGHGVAG